MDLQRLREQTRPEHEATEAAMPLMEPGLTLESYKSVLRVLLPLLRSWETWSAEHAPLALKPLLPARRRSHLLVEDLRSLGDPAPHASAEVAPIDWTSVTAPRLAGLGQNDRATPGVSQAAFLGALYVLEGSTLGGRIIARRLEHDLGFLNGEGDAYFRGHGEQTGAMWREITEAIAALPEEDSEHVIEAAKRTFTAFRSVLAPLGPPISTSGPTHA